MPTEVESTGGLIAAACAAFTGTAGTVFAQVRGVSKNGKANTADIEVTKTRVGALERRVEEEIADGKAEHNSLADSLFGMQKTNNEEHARIFDKIEGLGKEVSAGNATITAMNQNLERLLQKE